MRSKWLSLYKKFKVRPVYNKTDRIKPWAPPPLIKSKIAKKILITLALGAGGFSVTMNPAGAVYFMLHGAVIMAFNRQKFRQEVKRLENRGYVALTKTADGFAIRLLKKSKRRLKEIVFDDLTLPQPGKWDGRWRLFTFDIPEKQRSTRDTLRAKLKDLGMFNIQRSVYAYPYDCRQELEFIADYYKVAPNSTYIESNYIDIDRELRRHFQSLIAA